MEWDQVKEHREGAASQPDKLIEFEKIYREQIELIKFFYDNQVPMLVGSDFGGMAFIYPGYSLHEEMALMQDVGFNTYQILRMATYNPVEYFNLTGTHGKIEKGKVADIVILSQNPVEDINNTLRINKVIKAGKIVKSD